MKKPTDPNVCGVLMTPHAGDLSIGLGGARYCLRPVKEDGLCAVHLGHRKRRETNARRRQAYWRARAAFRKGDNAESAQDA